MTDEELEEKTLEFLREYDSKYFLKTGYKSNKIDYPYHSRKQQRDIDSKEIPLSNLSNKQRLRCPQFGDSHNFREAE